MELIGAKNQSQSTSKKADTVSESVQISAAGSNQ
jgi:hypothetical protein